MRKAVHDLGITYPVAMDNDYRIWRNFNNQFWPAHYFIDATGHVRYHHFGEGNYDESERWIRSLLEEANQQPLPNTASKPAPTGVTAAPSTSTSTRPDLHRLRPRRQLRLSRRPRSGRAAALPVALQPPAQPMGALRQLARRGADRYCARRTQCHRLPLPRARPPPRPRPAQGRQARPLSRHPRRPIPGANHGVDTDADGNGIVTSDRLYQLIRQSSSIQDRTFRIEFLSPGVQAYSFTFG